MVNEQGSIGVGEGAAPPVPQQPAAPPVPPQPAAEPPVGPQQVPLQGAGGEDASRSVIAAMQFKQPVYDEDPKLFFQQLDVRFELSNIRLQKTKYNLAFSSLPTKILKPVIPLLPNPDLSSKPYDDLRDAVIKRHTLSESRRLHEILNNMSIGDRTPSDFYRQMAETSNNILSEDVLYNLWIGGLPMPIRATMMGSTKLPLSDRLELADNISDVLPGPNVNTVKESSASEETLRREIAEMRAEMAELRKSRERSLSRSREGISRNFHRSKSRDKRRRENQDNSMCWYHNMFKERAKSCVPPCSYKAKN